MAVDWSSFFTWFESNAALVLYGRRNFLFGTGDGASDGDWFEPRLFGWNVEGNVVAEFMEAGAQLHGSKKKAVREKVRRVARQSRELTRIVRCRNGWGRWSVFCRTAIEGKSVGAEEQKLLKVIRQPR